MKISEAKKLFKKNRLYAVNEVISLVGWQLMEDMISSGNLKKCYGDFKLKYRLN
jgi:hypothetical protein